MRVRVLVLLQFILSTYSLFGQGLPDRGFDKIRIIDSGRVIVAQVLPTKFRTQNNLSYSWYNANGIHVSQGSYSGKPLNGIYEEFYTSNSLREKGVFINGLRDGVWKTWYENGQIEGFGNYKNNDVDEKVIDFSSGKKMLPDTIRVIK